MSEYGVYEAKTRLPDLIKQVARGERVTITNRGKPVVDLVPSASAIGQQTTDAISAILALRSAAVDREEFSSMRKRGRR